MRKKLKCLIMIVFQTYKPNYRNFASDNCYELKQEKTSIMPPKISQNEPIAYMKLLQHIILMSSNIYIYIYNLELGNNLSSQTKLNIYKVALLHSCLGNHKRSINRVHSTWPSPCFFELLLSHTWKKMKK